MRAGTESEGTPGSAGSGDILLDYQGRTRQVISSGPDRGKRQELPYVVCAAPKAIRPEEFRPPAACGTPGWHDNGLPVRARRKYPICTVCICALVSSVGCRSGSGDAPDAPTG